MGRKKRGQNDKPPTRWEDYMTLTKSSITKMCAMTAAGGYWLARPQFNVLALLHMLLAMVGITMVVAGSCALNMYLERENDRNMRRTAQRPLPSGRISAQDGLMFGLFLSVVGLAILAFWINLLTAALALVALISYVLIYTPLKRKTPEFLLVGTIPGAMPPLLGWTAATGEVQLPGVVLFAILIFWQLPHFLALSLMIETDYNNAGIRTLSITHGEERTRILAFFYTMPLIPISLMLVPLNVAGPIYLCFALVTGIGYSWEAYKGLRGKKAPKRWPYRLFYASLIYLPVLTLGLFLDQLSSLWL